MSSSRSKSQLATTSCWSCGQGCPQWAGAETESAGQQPHWEKTLLGEEKQRHDLFMKPTHRWQKKLTFFSSTTSQVCYFEFTTEMWLRILTRCLNTRRVSDVFLMWKMLQIHDVSVSFDSPLSWDVESDMELVLSDMTVSSERQQTIQVTDVTAWNFLSLQNINAKLRVFFKKHKMLMTTQLCFYSLVLVFFK